jgi:CheY-specific phosphatase CheX
MQVETIAEALGTSAQTVLETMFFVVPEGDAESSYLFETPLLRAGLAFRGEWRGTLELSTPLSSAKTLASSFAGVSDLEQVTEAEAGEVIRELANMVCGSTLSRLAGNKIFDMDSPKMLDAPMLWPAATSTTTTTRALDLGFGVVAFTLKIEDAL